MFAPPAFLSLSDWSLPDWVSIIGLPLALIGLAVGLFQLRDAKRTALDAKTAADHARDAAQAGRDAAATARDAAEAARASIQRTESHLADNHLLIYIPRLEQIVRELEIAVRSADVERTIAQLNEWRATAAQVRKLAEKQGGHDDLVQKLQKAAGLVGAAKGDLVGRRRPADEATHYVREAINDACDGAAEVVGERMAFIRRDHG
jgi:hypothetical protein